MLWELFCLRSARYRRELLLTAQRHNRDLAGAEIWNHHLRDPVALVERDVTRLGTTRGQIEQRPLTARGIVSGDLIGRPQVRPGVVIAVHGHVIGLAISGQRDVTRRTGACVDAR